MIFLKSAPNNVFVFLSFGFILLFFSCKRASNPLEMEMKIEKVAVLQPKLSSDLVSDSVLVGKVIHVDDGDTYTLLSPENKKLKVRMEGIDAPEGGMPYYRKSKDFLVNLIKGKTVKLKITGQDNNQRYLGFTYVNDSLEAGEELLKKGLAWHYKHFNSNMKLADMESEAKRNQIGLWEEENPVPPWIIRRLRRKGIATKNKLNPFKEKVFRIDQVNNSLIIGDLKLVGIWKTDEILALNIYKKGELIQNLNDLKVDKNRKSIEIAVADYNMDGNFDFIFNYDRENFVYYFFDAAAEEFYSDQNWKVKVWKQNKQTKEFLSLPIEGNEYSGYVHYYEVKPDNSLNIRTTIKYYFD